MIRHYYTLKVVENELKVLIGSKLVECFTQEKGELIMIFFDGKHERSIEFTTAPGADAIFLRRGFRRARKNTVELFTQLLGKVIKNIELIANERIFRFDFGKRQAYFFLFGGSRNNAFVVNRNQIVHSFKDVQKYNNTELIIPQARLRKFSDFPEGTKIFEALFKCDLLLGKYYAEELCTRIQLDKIREMTTFSEEKLLSIYNKGLELREECLQSTKYYLYEIDNKEWLLSLIPLQKNYELREDHKSISDAILYRIINTLKNKNFSGIYKEIFPKVKNELAKINANLKHIEQSDKTKERAEK